MKFRSEQGMLAEALGALSRIATSRNSSSPALAGVKLHLNDDTLVASSTDNDISLQFTLSVGGERNGQTLISARLLNDIVRALPNGKLTVDVGADSATLSAGRSQFTVPTLNAVEFPRTTPAPANPVTMSAKDLSFALNQVVRAASRDLGKQHLTAVLLRAEDTGLRLVATPIASQCATSWALQCLGSARNSCFRVVRLVNCNDFSTQTKKSVFVSVISKQLSKHRQCN